ncbi:MAG TPA: DNA methyltransferase [Microbacteriaceae bacterium]|jgi:DNA modification methylase|nr:DNA methyltransferase [Microbacteriaceae bacterium]
MDTTIFEKTGVIHCGDNLETLARMPSDSVDLIYLDPPFFSNRRYEIIWNDEAEVRSFEDRWKGGVREYIGWMRKRVAEMHRVLKSTGSLYLHCDPSASHYLKVMLDELFISPGGFRSEIVWKRSSAHSDTKQGRKQHGHIHDTIFFYTKSDDWTWKTVYTPYDQSYIESKYRHVDPASKRLYRLDNLTAAKPGGDTSYEFHGRFPYKRRYWAYSKAKMEQFYEEGRIHFPNKPDGVPELKRYLDEMPGVPLQDVWTDLDPINARAAERLGYPTQKPEALMERILSTSSKRGETVLDPFCGCGTTIAVAQQMQRRWIGIDISPQAASIMKRRVDGFGANATVIGLPATIEDLKDLGHFEFQNWVIEAVNGVARQRKTNDLGIDGYSYFERHPIQVKQSEKVGRNFVDNFETAIERDGKEVGYLVAFSFTKDAHGEAARSREIGKASVHLVRVADLLDFKDLVSAARAAREQPDVSRVTPDLMGLFAGALEERQIYTRPRNSLTELVESASKKRKAKQLRLA